jgi:hypothetical protein
MLSGESIVCIAPDAWGDIWRNRHRLLSVFARQNRVLYVEPRSTIRSLRRQLGDRSLRLREAWRSHLEEVRQDLFVYRPPALLPRIGKPLIGPLVDGLREGLLRRTLRRLGMSRPILWLVRPDAHDLIGRLDEKLVLYQIVDDYLSYPGVTPRARERLDREERLIGSRADLVVVTAEHLLELKAHLGPRRLLVRNAVDGATLDEARKPGPLPADLASAARPILGYIGGITEKLDLELLEAIAADLAARRGGTLALVGPVTVGPGEPQARIARLREHPRVIFTGQRPAAEVPSYLRAFDVNLIPYRPGDQARAIDPLKLYEYLAFGKPVVAIDIPSLRPFAGLVRIARSREDYLRHVWEAAAERDESLADRRRAAATQNTWEQRAEQISEGIVEALEARERAAVEPQV